MDALLNIVHEDDDLLVVNKPAGLVCHPTKGDAWSSLISRARMHLGPDATPALINRLDRETSGIVLIARTERADAGIKSLFTRRLVSKEYLAIAHGSIVEDTFECAEPLGTDELSIIAIKDRVRPDGKAAHTRFTVRQRFERAEARLRCCTSNRRAVASIRFESTSRIWAIRLWATSCMAAMKCSIWTS